MLQISFNRKDPALKVHHFQRQYSSLNADTLSPPPIVFLFLGLQLLHGDILLVLAHYGIGHLPHLNEVVLSRTADHPRIVRVPTEVRDAIRVAAVHEQSSRRVSE